MVGFVTDREVSETSDDVANQEYLSVPPSEGSLFGAKISQESTIGTISRAAERGLTRAFSPGNLLPADEINNRYAPLGPDGKQVKIASEPMYENVGELLGKQEGQKIDRQGIIARGEQMHDGIDNFTSSMAAFLVDPINTASMFVPGIGEEMAASAVGRAGLTGYSAKLGSRLIQGGTAGAAGTGVISGIKYGLDPDYGLREAFSDMAYGAAGGAIIHAGLGAAGDVWKSVRGTAEPETQGQPHSDATRILDADGTTKKAAMDASVAQMIDGREINVDPYFPPEYKENMTIADIAEQQKRIYEDGFAPGMTPDEIANATEELFPKEEEEKSPEFNYYPELGKTEEVTPYQDINLPINNEHVEEFNNLTTKKETLGKGLVDIAQGKATTTNPEIEAIRARIKSEDSPYAEEIKELQDKYERAKTNKKRIEFRSQINDLTTKSDEWAKGELASKVQQEYLNTDYRMRDIAPEVSEIQKEAELYNNKVDELSAKYNIDTKGKTREQFWDEVSNKLSSDQQAKEIENHSEASKTAFEEAEKLALQQAEEHFPSKKDTWDYTDIQHRTLEDLENEWKQEANARNVLSSQASITKSQPVTGNKTEISGRKERSGSSSEPPGQGGNKGGGDGTGRSNKEPRTSTGAGSGNSEPSELDNQIAQLQSKINLDNITDEERADLESANKDVTDADAYRKGYEAAANCLAGIV